MIKTCQLITNDASLKTNIEAEPTDLDNTKEIAETIVKIKPMSEEADPALDCSTLGDLEDFIDQSFQNMDLEPTPFQTRANKCLGIIAKEFSSFKS